jgi:hypothetical protein
MMCPFHKQEGIESCIQRGEYKGHKEESRTGIDTVSPQSGSGRAKVSLGPNWFHRQARTNVILHKDPERLEILSPLQFG